MELSKYQKECSALDAERVRIYGEGDLTGACPYSSDNGCTIPTHKQPICIAYTCPQLTEALKERGIDYDWFKVQTLLINVLNEAGLDWLSKDELDEFGIDDEKFSTIKKDLEESLKPHKLG